MTAPSGGTRRRRVRGPATGRRGPGRSRAASQYTTGMGQPQKRCLETSQSRSRKLTFRSPEPLLLEPFDGAVLGRRDVEPVEESAVDLDAFAGVRTTPVGLPVLRRLNGAHDGQPMQGGERPVALVLGRHRHDRPGAVAHEDVVGHVERDGAPGEGIDHVAAGEGATLLEGARIALRTCARCPSPMPRADGARRRQGAAPPVVSVSTSGCSGAMTA